VKAANILIDSDGRVVVSDFGVALRASDVTLTQAGTLIGTPAYMSPEQCSGRRAGPQSDQYSLAVVGFQMLAGTTPFPSETLAGIIQHHFFTPPPDLRIARSDIPAALLDLITQALSKDASSRFRSTNDMLAAIERIPLSDADRRASQRALRGLARGRAAPRIATGALPVLPDMPTLVGMPLPRRVRRVAQAMGYAAALVVLAAAGWVVNRPPVSVSAPPIVPTPAPMAAAPPAATRRAQESVLLARPVASETGKLRLLTSPPSAEILVDGRRVGVGSVFDLRVPAGARRVRVQAGGYQAWDTTIVVRSGNTHSLGRITLRAPGE